MSEGIAWYEKTPTHLVSECCKCGGERVKETHRKEGDFLLTQALKGHVFK